MPGAASSLDAMLNSFLAKPIDRASSGSFRCPQRNMITRTATMTSHSYPTNGMHFHKLGDASGPTHILCTRRVEIARSTTSGVWMEQTETKSSVDNSRLGSVKRLVRILDITLPFSIVSEIVAPRVYSGAFGNRSID